MSFERDLRVVGCGHSEKADVSEWGPGGEVGIYNSLYNKRQRICEIQG